MDTISQTLREKDAEKLASFITNSKFLKSWLVQGMPGGGIDPVFKNLVQRIENLSTSKEKIKVISIDFSSLWTNSLNSSMVQYFITPLPLKTPPNSDNSKNISSLLEFLRMTIKSLAEEGWQFVYVFNHFDSVLKFSNLEEIQEMLNTFQSLCYENIYRTSNIVESYRDIEDICRRTNYSDYYKVFGTNHTRISRVSGLILEQEIKKRYPEAKDKSVKNIIDLCGGYPEIADVILRETSIEALDSVDSYNFNNIYSAAFPFDRWVECLSPEELSVLEKMSKKDTVDKDLSFHKRKLLRKELLRENQQGEVFFTSPLFEHFLTERIPVKNSSNKVVIKRRGLLDSIHRDLLEDLFSDRFIIEIKLQQEQLPGNAYVFMVNGEDERGVIYRPCIVKVDESARSERENKNLEIARQILGTIVPSILKRNRLRGQDAVILEYATADNKHYTVQQFAEFYQKRNVIEIAQFLERVFDNALAPFYRTQKIVEKEAKKLYYLPRIHHGEYDSLSNIAQKSRYFRSGTLRIPGTEKILPNPGEYLKPSQDQATTSESNYERFFLSRRSVGLSMAHGDLNPRNLLIDGIENIHIIDFSELKEDSARFLDFVRLEAEIKFKLVNLDEESLETFITLESMLTETADISQLERISKLPFEDESQKMAKAVFTLRKIAFSICAKGTSYDDFILEYLLGLLTQTFRICLFQDYITDIQKEFAILSAALLINKLEERLPVAKN